ncbi:MAG: GNAT family N-acetyltransferase [Ardenticatenaceae bacterium]|nr:GNAT family N-acetyltransferase [Ardenticatenaceae bacterium]
MRQIRELTSADNEALITIMADAYPGMNIVTEADRVRFLQRSEQIVADTAVTNWGLFDDDVLLGLMRLFDFTMTLHETAVFVGGVGSVAVGLAHKKQKVARDMIQFFLRHYRERGAALVALYPFRPDFYRQMGFGYGTKMNQYRVKPASLPHSGMDDVVFLTGGDRAVVESCYDRYAAQTHGMFVRHDYTWDAVFSDSAMRKVGVKQNGRIEGYILFTFQPGKAGHFLSNDLLVRELVYETPEALAQLLTFLHRQADQIGRVVFQNQDDSFHYLLHDPRLDDELMLRPTLYHETNVQGLGLMYRVVDVPRLFGQLADHDFGGQTCRLKLTLHDSFLPENAGEWVIGFENGRARLLTQNDYDAAIELDVAEFSSLIMGTADFRQLIAYRLAAVSDTAVVETVTRLFRSWRKPVCLTNF